MGFNAAGVDVAGEKNPNWRGGLIAKTCAVCAVEYAVKPTHTASRYCSLQCVGISQRRAPEQRQITVAILTCEWCASPFAVPPAWARRYHCCSRACGAKRRGAIQTGNGNPSWSGGASRLPYTWDFRRVSKRIIARDGGCCQSPTCRGNDRRMTAHHIDYNKQNNRSANLITLCSACNSKANFGRERWTMFYRDLMQARAKKHGGGWEREEF